MKALIIHGGWDGHEPKLVSDRLADLLRENDFEVRLSDTLDTLTEPKVLLDIDLFVPVVTMSNITKEQVEAVSTAAADGMGIAGCHGGMCDAFRQNVQWQFITGGNWVSHPGGNGVTYNVEITDNPSPITKGIKDFNITSEHYYLHIDPAVEVLATTRFPHPEITWFHSPNKAVDMPVLWTKMWGAGRIFYSSLGHHNDVFNVPEALETMKRGMLWAAAGKQEAIINGISSKTFTSDKKMF
jgi:type 1 glutamine amidotransferase